MDASSLSVVLISVMYCKVLGRYTSSLIASVISLKNFLTTFDCISGSVLWEELEKVTGKEEPELNL